MPVPARNSWHRHNQGKTASSRQTYAQLLCICAIIIVVFAITAHLKASSSTSSRTSQGNYFLLGTARSSFLSFYRLGHARDPSNGDDSNGSPAWKRNASLRLSALADSAGSPEVSAAVQATDDLPTWDALGLEERVPVLKSTDALPLGLTEEAADSPLCAPFRASPGDNLTVAVVGNGPLNEAQRREIDAYDIVVRFNLMNNWRRFEERVNVWVLRFSTEAVLLYWGVTNMSPTDASQVLSLMKGVWLVGGTQKDAESLAKRLPELRAAHPVLIPQEPLMAEYNLEMNISDGSPSTGFAGLKGALHCTRDDQVLHLYGFNWHSSVWQGHKMSLEEEHIERLTAKGRVVVHPTACYGVRECGGTSKFDQSCHWDSHSRYICLRGKPRRWVDLTHTLGPGRLEQFQGSRQTTISADALANAETAR